jgi:hypothetical protein
MKNLEGKWLVNLIDYDVWDSVKWFDSKEEAIEYGKKEFSALFNGERGIFYVGQIESYIPFICGDRILEQVSEDAYIEVGEPAEDYLSNVKIEHVRLLEERLNKVLNEWIEETNNQPNFFKVVNVEKVEF